MGPAGTGRLHRWPLLGRRPPSGTGPGEARRANEARGQPRISAAEEICACAERVLARKDELEDALVDLRRSDALERQAIETAQATVYALMTGDIAHASDVVARDLDRWIERNKHLAQDIMRRQRSPSPHDSRRR